MKISEMIDELKAIQDQHGDLDVETDDGLVDSVVAESEEGHGYVLLS